MTAGPEVYEVTSTLDGVPTAIAVSAGDWLDSIYIGKTYPVTFNGREFERVITAIHERPGPYFGTTAIVLELGAPE